MNWKLDIGKAVWTLQLNWAVQYLTGDNQKVVSGWVFNFTLVSFASQQNKCMAYKQPLLELKTRLSFCPANRSFSMIECTSIESSIHFDISKKKINISNFQNFKILGCINIGMFLLKHLQNGRDCSIFLLAWLPS